MAKRRGLEDNIISEEFREGFERKKTAGSLRVPRNPFIFRSKSFPENRRRLSKSHTLMPAPRECPRVRGNLLCVRWRTEEASPKLPGKLSVFPRNFSYVSTRVGGFRRFAGTEIDGSSRSVLPFRDRGKVGQTRRTKHFMMQKLRHGWLSELSR